MRTTKKHFDAFKKEFLRYVELLGLKQWRVCFLHTHLDEDCRGELHYSSEGYLATVCFAKNMNKCDPKATAKHEAIHLLLLPLIIQARRRFTTPDDICDAWEQTVRVLEKVL